MNASIRNIALASGLTLLSLLGLATTVQAQLTSTPGTGANSTSGGTNLKVTIIQDCKFVSVPNGGALSVANTSGISGTTDTSPLTVTCNGNNFYVDAKSERNGALRTAIGSTGPYITYQIKVVNDTMGAGTYQTTNTGLLTTDTRIITKNGYVAACAASTGCSANLTWTLGAPSAALPVGTYEDTITYTLTAN